MSVEFNLLYRWHATLSKPYTEWTQQLFTEVFGTEDFKSASILPFDGRIKEVNESGV